MKLKFLTIALFLASVVAFGQGKVGAVDIEQVLDNMTEMKDVEENLKVYTAQLDLDLTKKIDSYRDAFEKYKKDEASLNDTDKKARQAELQNMENDIQNFQQKGAALLELKRQEYLRPLYLRIENALEKVAKAQKYTQVNQITPNLVYLDPAYDLTPAIMKELGIEVKSE